MTYNHIGNYVRFFTFVLLLMLFGCAAKQGAAVYISAPCSTGEDPIRSCKILYQVNSGAKAVQWSRIFDAEQLLHCADANTVYVGYGTNRGTICALHLETGEALWQTNCSLSWAAGSDMRFVNGDLYYPGNYNPIKQEYPLYTLSVDTLKETILPVGHTQLSNFSVYQGRIYTHGMNGVSIYDLETSSLSSYELPDLEYLFLNFYEDHVAIAYENRVEWYVITSSGLEQTNVITAEDMDVEQITVCAVSPSAFVFLARAVGDPWMEAELCAVTLDQGQPVVCDRATNAPSDVVFTDEGFYASWEECIVYYDWEGNQTTIWNE